MAVEQQTDETRMAISMTARQFWWMISTGVIVGVLVWLIGRVVNTWVFTPLFCHGSGTSACSSAPLMTDISALLIATGIGVWSLVRAQVFRPLLVGLAAALTLWGVLDMVIGLPWYVGAGIMALLFGLSYAAFGWIARMRSFLFAIIVSVLLLIVVRYVLTT